MSWPHKDSKWQPYLAKAQECFIGIIKNILAFEDLILVVPDNGEAEKVSAQLGNSKGRLSCQVVPANDVWARDFGPISILDLENNHFKMLDFTFNGWGMKHPCDKDRLISKQLHKIGTFGKMPLESLDYVLEGGSIDCDGQGSILTTSKCLLSTKRNPGYLKTNIEDCFNKFFGTERILWLEHGALEGDDTDSHIDTLARFADPETILYVSCDKNDDSHFEELKLMENDLKLFRTKDGKPYKLVPLPWPDAKYDDKGMRLPATYANFLILNEAVLVPTYRDSKDGEALGIISEVFTDRKVIGVDCLQLIHQGGSLHCTTMQLPK